MKNTKKDFDPDPTSGSDLGSWEPELMGKCFLKKIFTPIVYIQNGQRVMGIILRYVCWGTHQPPPPPARGARRLTARPADPQGLGQPRGGGDPLPWGRWGTPLQPPKRLHTPWGHTLAGSSPRGPEACLRRTETVPETKCSNGQTDGSHKCHDTGNRLHNTMPDQPPPPPPPVLMLLANETFPYAR